MSKKQYVCHNAVSHLELLCDVHWNVGYHAIAFLIAHISDKNNCRKEVAILEYVSKFAMYHKQHGEKHAPELSATRLVLKYLGAGVSVRT